jgi:hypothetical protein
MANRIFAQLVRRGGSKLLDRAVAGLVPGEVEPAAAPRLKRSLTRALAGAVITRIATRSVPGAIIVGGGMLAKTLYDRKKAGKGGDPDNGKT